MPRARLDKSLDSERLQGVGSRDADIRVREKSADQFGPDVRWLNIAAGFCV